MRAKIKTGLLLILPWFVALTPAFGDTGSQQCTSPAYAMIKPTSYPPGAVRDRTAGKTILLVEVRADGVPGEISVRTSSGNAELDAAAKDQVAAWRFEPSRCNGTPRSSYVAVPVDFSLTDQDSPQWQVAADDEPMERKSISSEISYLRTRGDLQERKGPSLDMFSAVGDGEFWLVVKSEDLTAIFRARQDRHSEVYRGLYSFMCEGPSERCAARLADQVSDLKANPMPPQPANQKSASQK